MLQVALFSTRIAQAKTAAHLAIVFDLENNCPATGHSLSRFFFVSYKAGGLQKTSFEKQPYFLDNIAIADASVRERKLQNKSACFVQLLESQMKRKASATQSPFDRGLLLGQRAFLF